MYYKPHILRRAGDSAREPRDRRVVGRLATDDEVTRQAIEDAQSLVRQDPGEPAAVGAKIPMMK